jgi:hypothetical protein
MTESPNLKITHIAVGQSQKETTHNQGVDAIDKAENSPVDIDCSAGGTIVVGVTDYRRNIMLRLTGSPAATFLLQVPDGARFFAIENKSGQAANVDTTTGGDSAHEPPNIPDGTTAILFSYATDLIKVA